jgi:uncharacterized phage protein (TIGR01671 family)
MREILFRGKRLDNGEWLEGAFCPKDSDDPFGPVVDRPSIIKLDPPCAGFWFEVDPATVGQYTGLTDKNGKRIFEGDIVCFRTSRCYEVKCGDGCFYMDGTAITAKYLDRFTVIGNIHDNPELLQEEHGA